MTALIKVIITSLLSLFFFSCNFDGVFNQLDGKGEIITQEHEIEAFNQITVEKGWDVVLIKSDQPKLVVKANENLLENLKFSVSNQLLSISSKKNIGRADAKIIQVYYTDELQKIASQSGAEITSNEVLKQDKLQIDASSGSEIELQLQTQRTEAKSSSGADMELTGSSDNFEAKASSGSEIDTQNLITKSASASASSGSEITLSVSENFTAKTSSGGEINYYGNPKSTSLNNSISGSIHKK